MPSPIPTTWRKLGARTRIISALNLNAGKPHAMVDVLDGLLLFYGELLLPFRAMDCNVEFFQRTEVCAGRAEDHEFRSGVCSPLADLLLDSMIRQVEPCPRVTRVAFDKPVLAAQLKDALRRVHLGYVNSSQNGK